MNPNDTENQNMAPQAAPADGVRGHGERAGRSLAGSYRRSRSREDGPEGQVPAPDGRHGEPARRTEREVADARTYAVANFARDMLNVADNVRRGIESVPEEARASAEGAFKGLIEGIDLTERDLLKTLERHGVKKLDPQGQKFDPNLHQAMFEVPNPEVPSGTVVQVVQSGYVIGDRVLRPALVGVAKGGPKATGSEPQHGKPTVRRLVRELRPDLPLRIRRGRGLCPDRGPGGGPQGHGPVRLRPARHRDRAWAAAPCGTFSSVPGRSSGSAIPATSSSVSSWRRWSSPWAPAGSRRSKAGGGAAPCSWADALGLALFAVVGTGKALAAGVPAVSAMALGTVTATFGGIIRDIWREPRPWCCARRSM